MMAVTLANLRLQLRAHIGDITAANYIFDDEQLDAGMKIAITELNRLGFPTSASPYEYDGSDTITPEPDFHGKGIIVSAATCRILWLEFGYLRTPEFTHRAGGDDDWRGAIRRVVAEAKINVTGAVPTAKIIQLIGIDENGLPDQWLHSVDTFQAGT